MHRIHDIPIDPNTAAVGPLRPTEASQAVRILVRDLVDTPNCIATLGADRALRCARLESLFEDRMSIATGETLAARDADGSVMGLMPLRKPGHCALSSPGEVRAFSRFYARHPGVASGVQRWRDVWNAHDPVEPHWHFGGVLVGTQSQSTSIASALLHVLCAQLDAGGHNAYLETDRSTDVSFYGLFGFKVIAEDEVLGVANWFMFRRPLALLMNGVTEARSDERRFPRRKHRRPEQREDA